MNDFAETLFVCAIGIIIFLAGVGVGYAHGYRNHHKNAYDERGNLTCEICKELKEWRSK